jgi:hypothetical protein
VVLRGPPGKQKKQIKEKQLMSLAKSYRNRRSSIVVALIALAGAVTLAFSAVAARSIRVAQAVWAHGDLYDVVVTDTEFKSPPPRSLDVLYNFGDSGLSGQRSVSESAPGDRDYNGGRWAVTPVEFTPLGMAIHDPDGDGWVNFELKSAEQVMAHAALGHLVIHPVVRYFECPLLPRR